MKRNLRWKLLLIIIVIGVSFYFSLPYQKKINLGLDLQGGMHLTLEVQSDKALAITAERYVTDLKEDFKNKKIPFEDVIKNEANEIIVHLTAPVNLDQAQEILGNFSDLRRARTTDKGTNLVYAFRDAAITRIKENAVEQALETLRNRIDQFGVAEPTVQREGDKRIVVQLPGIKEPQRAIDLLGKTALLEFKMVDEEHGLQDALDGKVPEGSTVSYQRHEDKTTGKITKTPFLLKKRTLLTGDAITRAEVKIDQLDNLPYVFITFDKIGTKIFSQITEENVKKRLAILLDGNVYSAPVIQEKITGGEARITGRFTMDEAKDLAIVLRSGSLPAPIKILENITVGPSLGSDSIRKGLLSGLVGCFIVILFMIVYYNKSGLIADFALILNIIILLGAIGYIPATLTLPGIAGIFLTVGIAVDANVLIYERIREELRLGKSIRSAVEMGFRKALVTIIDANITGLITALILFQFGTGPIKGFAVTLSLGILISMFTAIFVVRVVFDLILSRKKVTRLSI